MKKENANNVLVKDMTDEEIYELAVGVVKVEVSRRPIILQTGVEIEDIVNRVFLWFYDKETRGRCNPITEAKNNNYTKKHLENIFYMSFRNDISYNLRKPKEQVNIHAESMYAYRDPDDNTGKAFIDTLEDVKATSQLLEVEEDETASQYIRYINDNDNNIEKDYVLALKDVNGNTIYKAFSYKTLARIYLSFNEKNGKVLSERNLRDLIGKKKEDNSIGTVSNTIVRKLANNMKEKLREAMIIANTDVSVNHSKRERLVIC